MSERIETVVLDSEELSAWIAQDRRLLAMLQVFHGMGADLVIGANTIVEASHSRTDIPRLNWALSRIKVERSPSKRPKRQRSSSTAPAARTRVRHRRHGRRGRAPPAETGRPADLRQRRHGQALR